MTIRINGPWPTVRDCLGVIGSVTVLDGSVDRLLMSLSGGAAAAATWDAHTETVEITVIDDDPAGTAAADLYYVILAVTGFPVSLHTSADQRVLARRTAAP